MNRKILLLCFFLLLISFFFPTIVVVPCIGQTMHASFNIAILVDIVDIYDSTGRLVLNITNIGTENISMETLFVTFKGHGFFCNCFFKENASTIISINNLTVGSTQTLKTQDPIAHIRPFVHRPFLFGIYYLDMTFLGIPQHLILKIIGKHVIIEPI